MVIRQIEMHDQIQIGSIQTKYCPCSHSNSNHGMILELTYNGCSLEEENWQGNWCSYEGVANFRTGSIFNFRSVVS